MTKTLEALRTRLVADLRPAFEGWTDPVAVGIGLDGAIYAAARKSSEGLTEKRGIGIFPKSRLEEATDYLVIRWQDGQMQSVTIQDEAVAASFVQPVPRGILLVGARCHWRPEGAEKNAVVVDWSGRQVVRFTLGDGIQDVRVTHDGTIWASYFDEGVFGNYGWGHPGPSPIGAPGLVAFSTTGQVRFSYEPNIAHTDAICDAYAMNVAGDTDVWLYFYTEFPIVRILDGGYHVWKLGVAGARAFAVRESRVLLFGDYKRRSVGRMVELGRDGEGNVIGERLIVDDDGHPLDDALAWGVGGNLFFFKDRRVLLAEDW
jgi:hypothetical protein